ncbi:hypothetical protein B0I35DRAFT_454380 [Stachybotrys elegans]|uniref:Uncharacterized protein n=1 Tax=Stachybotrys elegans TaxID=80388 RepID=A0A8K0SFW7_9HYPO|nr:hypothetical protein B0I35DRAFT_454380 [Stachybotrys elegans]
MTLTFSLLAAAPLIASVFAAPSTKPGLDRRQDVDCAPNSSTGLKAECWAALDMNTFITDWVATNCAAADCANLGFAQAFLQFNGFTGLTCDLITSSTCPPFATNNPDEYESQQHFYALWNIYAVYQFFNQYSTALSNGIGLAGQTVDQIVAAVAPPVDVQAETSALMNIFGTTLNVASLFSGFIPGGASTAVGLIHSGLTAALGFAEGLGDTLVSQTSNQRFVQLGQIGASLAGLVEDYQNNLLAMVQEVQRNHEIFMQACGDGGFSQRITTSLTIQSSELYRSLQLFVLSSALKANGLVSSRSTGVSALTVAAETGQISCDSLSEVRTCNQWFVDEAAGNTYALHNPNDRSNTQIDLLVTIIDNGWATMDELFKVEDCQGQTPTFDRATLGISCLTTHGFCEWNYFDSTSQSRENPQFTNCDNDPNWPELCGSFQDGIVVPESYLGPLLQFSQAFCKR